MSTNIHFKVVSYLENPEEYEWIKAETKALMKVNKEYGIVPSYVSFEYESGKIPSKKPKKLESEILWYLEMNRVHNIRLLRHLKHKQTMENMEKEEIERQLRLREDTLREAQREFWWSLKLNNYALFVQLKNANMPLICEERDRLIAQYVKAYVEEGKDLFM